MISKNPKTAMSLNTRYLPGLDGLRAIAVIAIIIYHLNPKWLSGGFIGVDTFFVISGYLITSLLLNEFQQNGHINLLHFWEKRIKRLLPAVLFLIASVCIYTLLFEPSIIKDVRHDAIAAIFYVSNWWYIFHHVSYFDSFKLMPLKHLWSLAIEEQFYIIWPIFLSLFFKNGVFNKKAVLWTFIVSIISVLIMIFLAQPNADNSRVYFGTDTRLQTLLLGVLLAYIWPPFRLKRHVAIPLKLSIEFIGLVSLFILLFFMFTVSSSDNWFYFGGIYIISLLTLPAIASSVHPSTLLSKALGNPLFLWIGQRSYSLYLWHYPVIVFINRHFVQGQIPIYIIIIEICLTILFAEFSYRYVEIPFRKYGFKYLVIPKGHLKFIFMRITIIILLIGVTSLTLFGHFDYLHQNKTKENLTSFQTSGKETNDKSIIKPVPPISVNKELTDHKNTESNKDEPAPLFIGDSVMVDIGKQLHQNYPSSIIDGKVGRNLNDAIPLVKDKYSKYTTSKHKVVIELGTNGDFTYEKLKELVNKFGKSQVYLVNTHVPRDWEDDVNKKLYKLASQKNNVHLIDWHSKAKGRSDYFAYDGVHLEYKGVRALVEEIDNHLNDK